MSLPQNRVEWLKQRMTGVGGSDAPIVCGFSKFKSPMGLWLEKTGQVEPEEAGEAAYWGNVHEPVIAEEFKRRHPEIRVQRRTKMYRSKKYPFIIGNIDRHIFCKDRGHGVLEIKTANEWLRGEWASGNIPPAYRVQIQHYLYVTGYEWAYVAVLIGGNKYVEYVIDRDEDLIQMVVERERLFWQYVTTETPPFDFVDGSQASSDILKFMFRDSIDEQIVLPEDAIILAEQREKARENEKHWKEQKVAAENKLKAMLGNNESGLSSNWLVGWKAFETSDFNMELFKTDMPQIYAGYCTKKQQRRFSLKEIKIR